MNTRRAKTVSAKDDCPHCQKAIVLDVISQDKSIVGKEFIDNVDSKLYQKMIESTTDSSMRLPKHSKCPHCKGIIFFLEVPDITIINIDVKKSLAKK